MQESQIGESVPLHWFNSDFGGIPEFALSVHVATLHSLANKTDKLLLLNGTNKDYSPTAAQCFMETQLGESFHDSLHIRATKENKKRESVLF